MEHDSGVYSLLHTGRRLPVSLHYTCCSASCSTFSLRRSCIDWRRDTVFISRITDVLGLLLQHTTLSHHDDVFTADRYNDALHRLSLGAAGGRDHRADGEHDHRGTCHQQHRLRKLGGSDRVFACPRGPGEAHMVWVR